MTEIDADRPSYTNDRAQVTEEMVNVYIETMWPDLWSSRRAIGDLRAQVRIGLTAALAAAPKPDRPSASTIETMAKEAVQAREYLSGLLTHFAPQCKPLADLYGLCTQIDNLLVWMAAPKADRPSAENIGRLVKAAGRALGALQNSSDMISSDINMAYDGKKWAQRPIDDLDAALAPFTDPQQEGEKSAGVASAAPAAMTSLSDALAHIAAVGTGVAMKAQWNALHTILSTLVAEREAQGRRDERVREAARKLGSETYDVALSALAAALGEDGR